jgi:hypothetical protein
MFLCYQREILGGDHEEISTGAAYNDLNPGPRLPQTSLHYSLDECQTWSDNVLVDDFIGAYPSMVNLKDGSVLIVYYEEGERSSIRARRFRATKSGVEWLTVGDR